MKKDIINPTFTICGSFEYSVNTLILFTGTTIVFTDIKNESVLTSINIEDLRDIISIEDDRFKVYLVLSPLRTIIIPCVSKELRDELINKIFNFKTFINYYYDKKVVIDNNKHELWPNILTLREISDIKICINSRSIKFYNLIGGFKEVTSEMVANNNDWFMSITDNINTDKLTPYSKIRNIFYNEED